MRKIGVIVVHGVGEQRRFEFLESIACNLYRAVRFGLKRHHPQIQLRRGDQVPHLSEEESWREAPAIVSWQHEDENENIEVRFREVHWADLDMPITWWRWFKLVGWSLSMSGVRLFRRESGDGDMCAPNQLDKSGVFLVKLQLFLVSLMFFLMLITVDLAYGLITRFGFQAVWLGRLRGIIYNYLGDVKLYQDLFVRDDDRLETLGEKSRVAIRRRMIRTMVQTAWEANQEELDEYYIWAHSLGTVVAFNGLMEPELALPNYFSREEWESDMCGWIKTKAEGEARDRQMPARPPWLDKHDAISRERLFAKFRGFLTMGSPLDKFATLWPSIVLANRKAIQGEKPWINVADVQDIVAGPIDRFPGCENRERCVVGGLKLENIDWGGELTLLSAHTSYWHAKKGKNRLIDQLALWLENSGSGLNQKTELDGFSKPAMKLVYALSFPALGLFLLWLASSAAWLFAKSGAVLQLIARKAVGLEGDIAGKIMSALCDGYWAGVLCWGKTILLAAVGIVLLLSLLRPLLEIILKKS